MESRRLSPAVCGIGTVTGYGWGKKHLWDGLLRGDSAVRPTPGFGSLFDRDEIWVAMIPDDETAGVETKFSRSLRAAAGEAVEDARDRGWRPGPTVGLIHAVVLGEVGLWRDFYGVKGGRASRREYVQLMPSTVVTNLMIEHGFHGPCMNVVAMCASGNAALLTAKLWLDAGVVDDVLVVATDVSGTPENARQMVDLGVVVVDSPPLDACRPFQEGSRGFVGGEASVGLVVSSRPAGAYATILGGAMSHDAHHAIALAGKPEHIEACYRAALVNAHTDPEDIVYFNAHGPGTRQCDRAEAQLFDQLFPGAAGIFSFKPLVGHCQGAAAAVEVAISCLAYQEGTIPAPPAVAPGHPRLVSGPIARQPGVTFKSSIGMGGYNTALLLDEPDH
ncbi:MAG TPA: beta-ketoacyl synthase N-terminal-like domain-containing protein [Acidimicrobiia bacterium]|jgi:3-oxoacyl-[acyl-carrier-protein] synthase II|nr:beta-ketoacyl synthase N-terminal-like domain-containing protein [Acidimicrobiia bacterium]